ncbi:MAG: hydrolase [Parcubacteria group bacterium]|nr:hydrolase [Parcubacteria group bacterium]
MDTLCIPAHFFNSFYDGSRYPGSGNCEGLEKGANCQYFAYELLKYFGYKVPDLRSSNLWEDETYTRRVEVLEPLDILFFNSKEESYGAHMGVYIGSDKVIHLSKEVGYPIVWDLKDFKNHPNYSVLLGAKRAKQLRDTLTPDKTSRA